jgi:hypothetical protein
MVAATSITDSQTQVLAAVRLAAAAVVDSQTQILAASAYPSDKVSTSQVQVLAAIDDDQFVQTSQVQILVAAAGSITDPAVRAWTFTLDNHNFYVLRLGNLETLVYDEHTQQWYTWGTGSSDVWKAYNGTNWYGGDQWSYLYGSNVITGDDGNGSLYFLSPFQDTDDSPIYGQALPGPFKREVYGQLPFRGYKKMPCYNIQVQASIGAQADVTINTVDLTYSDDRGQTYQDAGSITIPPGAIDTRLSWRSLGAMKAPGRLFRLVDYGALKRIDSMEMPDGNK